MPTGERKKLWILLPGRTFTQNFVQSWSRAVNALTLDPEIEHVAVFEYSADIYWCRNNLLMGGKPEMYDGVKPFHGASYDWILWIDSDMSFTYEDIKQIISHEGEDEAVITGACPIDKNRIAAGRYAIQSGKSLPQYLSAKLVDEIPVQENGLHQVDFAGGAFLAVRQGVYESIGFPWYKFRSHPEFGTWTSEDVGFTIAAGEQGYTTWLDPKVKIGHKRSLIFQP